MLSRAEYFLRHNVEQFEPRAKRQTWEETAHQIRLSPPGSAECDRRWCFAVGEREGRRGSDWQRHLSSTWTAELLAANPDNAFVILVGALRRPGSDSGLHSAKNATVSGALVHRRRCSRRDSTHSVKKRTKKSGFDPNLWSCKPFLFIYLYRCF